MKSFLKVLHIITFACFENEFFQDNQHREEIQD